jgi:uncharacterized pyridoxal phosphate-dependent enzyme
MTDVYAQLGVRKIINAATTFTAFGGSLMPEEVLDAMRTAAGSFVDMHELHLAAGARVAELTRNEAALITSGCATAMLLGTLACRTRGELRAIAALPESPGTPDEVVMHASHRIPYDPAIRLAGARIVQVGNALQTFDWEFEAALNQRTAAVLYVAGSHLPPAALPLEQVVEIAHRHDVPVIVDAAAQLPPMSNLWHFTADAGADLVTFSGGKALRGPQASGLLLGRADLVEAARQNAAPFQRLARAMKAGKEEIAGLLTAVARYVALDHDAEHRQWESIVEGWAVGLAGLPGVDVDIDSRNEAGQPVPRLYVHAGRGSGRVVDALRQGEPSILVLPDRDVGFWIGPDQLRDGEAETVLTQVRHVLANA